jgi:hypothetical protein
MKQLVTFLLLLNLCSLELVAQNVGVGTATPLSRLDVSGALSLKQSTAPLTLVNGNNNNVAIGNWSQYRITGPTAAFTLTGLQLATVSDGFVLTLINNSTQRMTIAHENTGSLAANRIRTQSGMDITLNSNAAIVLMYNGTDQRWYPLSSPDSRPIQFYNVKSSSARTNVTSATHIMQPGMTQTIVIPAGKTATLYISTHIGTRNVSLAAGNFSTVDAVIYYDGVALISGGWQRMTTVNHGTGNSLGCLSFVATIPNVGAGTHTVDLRTARVSGNSGVDIGGDPTADTTTGEMTITVVYN